MRERQEQLEGVGRLVRCWSNGILKDRLLKSEGGLGEGVGVGVSSSEVELLSLKSHVRCRRVSLAAGCMSSALLAPKNVF